MAINNAHFVPQTNMNVVFAAGMNSALNLIQVQTATLRQVTNPYLKPLILALIPGNSRNIADYRQRPLVLKALEEIAMFATLSAAGPTRTTILAALTPTGIPPAPNGMVYTLRGTSATAAVANAWTTIAMTWENNLPAGRYSIVGMRHESANGQGARMVIENLFWRPGCISSNADTDQIHEMFLKGNLGEFGQFAHNRMPTIEVLANGADAAHEVFLDIVRIG
jgi:hypothetical protein